jgi:glycosyltransferase involved in cell wall biosynthesis
MTFRIGSAGRLFPVKNYSLMVDIANTCRLMADKVQFTLAGEGPEQNKLQHMVKYNNLEEHFEFAGHIENMENFYHELDIYINTSIHEGISISVLEAMSHGLPVIVPDVGGMREIVDDGVNGYLIPSRNPLEFAEKCILLFNNKKLYDDFSVAARKKIENKFSVRHMTEEYLKLYHNV